MEAYMFGKTDFEPWVGDQYGNRELRLLVIGESRYDEEFTDKQIIHGQVIGNRHKTFTNFVQAATGHAIGSRITTNRASGTECCSTTTTQRFSPAARGYRCRGTSA